MIKNSLANVPMSGLVEPSGKGLSILISSSYNHYSNWMAYSSWYSIYKNIPDAKVAIMAARPAVVDICYYNWVYKCEDLRYSLHKNIGEKIGLPYLNKIYSTYIALKEGLVKQPLIVLDADMMAVGDLTSSMIYKLNTNNFITNKSDYGLSFEGSPVGSVWYLNNQPLEKIAEAINTIKTLKGSDHLDLLALSKTFKNDNIVIEEELCREVKSNDLSVFAHYSNGCGNFTKKDWEKGKTVPPFNVAYALYATDTTVNEKKVLKLWSQMGGAWDLINQVKV